MHNHPNISEWIHSDNTLTKEAFEIYKKQTRQLSPDNQILFLKRVFNQIHLKNIELSIADLLEIKTYDLETFQEFGEPASIDYKLDLIIHTIKFLSDQNGFPEGYKSIQNLTKSIADIVCNYLQNDIEYLEEIDLLFNECIGRTSIVLKKQEEPYISLNGNDYKVYDMYQGYSLLSENRESRASLVIHRRKGIYAKGKKLMLQILSETTNQNFISDEIVSYGDNIVYKEKLYPFIWATNKNEYLIVPEEAPVKSCEGRKSDAVCEISKNEFWWCYNRKCLKANQDFKTVNNWKKYSLKDFLSILKIPVDEIFYHTFVSEINRLNRLLKRLNCKNCNAVLKPLKQSQFAFYRVTRFECTEETCSSNGKEIYLTHCLNKRCTNVIDSRVAKKCSNGFVICDTCGSCCSNELFSRRIDNLRINGQYISADLDQKLKDKLGHWEKAECFCYKCQNLMTNKNENFECKSCSVEYERYKVYVKFHKDYKKNKFKKAGQNPG